MQRPIRVVVHFFALVSLIATLFGSSLQPQNLAYAQEDPPTNSESSEPTNTDLVRLVGEDDEVLIEEDTQDPSQEADDQNALIDDSSPISEDPQLPSPSAHLSIQEDPEIAQTTSGFLVDIVSSPTVRADEQLTYSIYFTNTTGLTFEQVLLQNTIGANQKFEACVVVNNCSYTYTGTIDPPPSMDKVTGTKDTMTGRELVWRLATVAPGAYGKITYTVKVRNDIYPKTRQVATVLGNTAALYRDSTIGNSTKLSSDEWGALVVGPVFNLTKTVNLPNAVQGDVLEYTILVGNTIATNDNPDGLPRRDAIDATNVVVYDDLPGHITVNPSDVQDGGVVSVVNNATRITWTIPSLKVGESRELRFKATIKLDLATCSNINNSNVFVTSNEIPYNNASTQTRFTIKAQSGASTTLFAPLVINNLKATPSNIMITESSNFSFRIANYWNTNLTGVTVKVILPSSFEYISSEPPAVFTEGSPPTVTWTDVSFPVKTSFDAPGMVDFSVQVRAKGPTIGNHALDVQVTLPSNDVPSTCIRPAARNIKVEPLLETKKSVNKDSAFRFEEVVYTIDVFNKGLEPLTDVTITDLLPNISGIPFQYIRMEEGPNPNTTSSTSIRWDNLYVPGGSKTSPGKITLKVVMRVDGVPTRCSSNTVLANSSRSNAIDTKAASVCILSPLSFTKQASRQSINPLDQDNEVEFWLTMHNNLNQPLTIQPRDQINSPSNVARRYTFLRMVEGPEPITGGFEANGRLEWPAFQINGGETVTYKFRVALPREDNGRIFATDYCNTAYAAHIGEVYENYTPKICLRVSDIVLRVSKSVDRQRTALGELVTYTINVQNRSTDNPVQGVTVKDVLPNLVTYVSYPPDQKAPAPTVSMLDNGRQQLLWQNLRIEKNSTLQIRFTARMPGLIGTYTNEVEVFGGSPSPAYDCNRNTTEGNCLSTAEVYVENRVTSDIIPSVTEIEPNGVVSFELTFVNVNDKAYDSMVITTSLPLGFTFRSMVAGPQPTVLGNKLVWYNQTLPRKSGNTPGTLSLSYTAQAPLAYGRFLSDLEATSPVGIIPPLNEAAEVVITPPAPALSLTGPTLIEKDSVEAFRVTIVNPKTDPLGSLTVTTVVPDGFTYVPNGDEGDDGEDEGDGGDEGDGEDEGDGDNEGDGEEGEEAQGLMIQSNYESDFEPIYDSSSRTLTWIIPQVPASDGKLPAQIQLYFKLRAPSYDTKAVLEVKATGDIEELDQTYNKLELIVANIKRILLPIVMKI